MAWIKFGHKDDNGREDDVQNEKTNSDNEQGVEDRSEPEDAVSQDQETEDTPDSNEAEAENNSTPEKPAEEISYPNTEPEPEQQANDYYSEKNKRYVIGEAAGTFYQMPFMAQMSEPGAFHRNDLVADTAKIGNLLVMGASLRGESHYAYKQPRQDSFLIEECKVNADRSFAIAAVADGVGNSKKSDDFSEMLVNFLCRKISADLRQTPDLDRLNWDAIADYIWKLSVNYCYKKSGSQILEDYFQNWASTLECVVVETSSTEKCKFVTVSICGDGGVYKIDSSGKWSAYKRGKTRDSNAVSNLVSCLPDKPSNLIVTKGSLEKGEVIFLVTDGLGDYIEAYGDVRAFFRDRLPRYNNLPEFIRVLNVAVKQMDDDKTGILFTFYDDQDHRN